MKKLIGLEEGWWTLFLVWGMVFVTAWALSQANYLPGLDVFMAVGTFGVLAGLLLAKSRFSDNTAALFSAVYGAFLIAYLLGRTLPADMLWHERIVDLLVRQVDWFQKAFTGGTSRDGLIFVLQTSVIFWILGYTASWYTFRKLHIWRVILPSGLVMLSVIYYYYGDKPLIIYLGVYFLLALLYVVQTYLVDQERGWREAEVRYERGINLSFMRAGFLASALALAVAWSLPTLGASASVGDALTGVNRPWREFQDNWTRLFSSLRSYGSPNNDLYQGSLVLGGPRNVNNGLVMDIYVPEKLPSVYWQSDSLATYDDGFWDPLDGETELHYPDDGVLNTPFVDSREVLTQTVLNYISNAATIYGAPEIIGVDRQVYVTARTDAGGSLLVDGVKSRYLLRPGDIYEVRSRISIADATSLRLATQDYPDWVTDAYLQVPDSITPETIALAEQLTAPYDNPYDKALAVQNYLRENITYNDQVPAPPEGEEPIHYTLFVRPEGYCNYYASAMAIMLRSQGIPSRLVRGYAQGEYIEDLGAYRVRANNAHTWVEVYFPEYGWIEFEPTASLPAVERAEAGEGELADLPGGALRNPLLEREEMLAEDDLERMSDLLAEEDLAGESAAAAGMAATSPLTVWRVVGSLAILLVLTAVFMLAGQMNARVEGDVTRSYGRLESWARWLGIFFGPAHTPYERADLLVEAVPEGKMPIRNLTQQFVLQTFSPRRATDGAFDPRSEWRVLRPLLIRKSFLARLAKLRRRPKPVIEDRFGAWAKGAKPSRKK